MKWVLYLSLVACKYIQLAVHKFTSRFNLPNPTNMNIHRRKIPIVSYGKKMLLGLHEERQLSHIREHGDMWVFLLKRYQFSTRHSHITLYYQLITYYAHGEDTLWQSQCFFLFEDIIISFLLMAKYIIFTLFYTYKPAHIFTFDILLNVVWGFRD